MKYKGHVENGVIVLDESAPLEEGARVSVEVTTSTNDGTPTLAERLSPVIGKAEGLPADWSERHDAHLRQNPGS